MPRFRPAFLGAVIAVCLIAGTSTARADLAAGPLFRVMKCVKNCAATVFTFGGEFGGGFTSFAFRYGYKDDMHYLLPDIRLSYTFSLPMSFEVTPLFEFTPMFGFAKVSGVSVKTLELILRPGVRVGWSPVPLVCLFVEPFLWDFGVYSKSWASSSQGAGSASSSKLVHRYSFGFGALIRF